MTTKLQAISGAVLIGLLLMIPAVTFAVHETDDEGNAIVHPTTPAAGADSTADGLGGAVDNIKGIVDTLIPLMLTLAIVVFIWGLVKYLFKIGGEEGSKGGLQIMLWGVIVIFVMVSIWGLVALLGDTFNISDAETGAGKAGSLKVD